MNVAFMVRQEFKEGSLAERMIAEGLPPVLKYSNPNNGRIERVVYECSEELALAMLRAGADLEFTRWSPDVLEFRKVWNIG